MNRSIVFIFFMFLFSIAEGQSNYIEAMKQGDSAFKKQQYKKAINYYFAAAAFQPENKGEVKDRVNLAFDRIEALRAEAEIARRDAIKAEAKTKAALARAEKFVNAFNFYDNKYALIYKFRPLQDEKFGFIDKEGNSVFNDRYEKAEEFDEHGFAKVQIWEGKYGECCNSLTDYLMDTSGKKYNVLYQLDTLPQYANVLKLGQVKIDSIPEGVSALDLRKRKPGRLWAMQGLSRVRLLLLQDSITQIPKEIEQLKGLESLYVNYAYLQELPPELWQLTSLETLNLRANRLKTLSPGIARLRNLKKLDLSGNNFHSLPKEIGQLKKLTWLKLSNNNFSKTEIERIKKLLPGCKILTG
jgi:hypothetical protein